MSYIGYRGMSLQISARELQNRAAEILEQNPEYSPVIINPQAISATMATITAPNAKGEETVAEVVPAGN